jgi:hypothetical protein
MDISPEQNRPAKPWASSDTVHVPIENVGFGPALDIERLAGDRGPSEDGPLGGSVTGDYLHFCGLQFLRTQRAASAEIQVPSGGVPNSRS